MEGKRLSNIDDLCKGVSETKEFFKNLVPKSIVSNKPLSGLQKRAPEPNESVSKKSTDSKSERAGLAAANPISLESTPKKGLSFLQGAIKNKTIKLQTLLDVNPQNIQKDAFNESRFMHVEAQLSDEGPLSETRKQARDQLGSPFAEELKPRSSRSTGKKSRKEAPEVILEFSDKFLTMEEIQRLYTSKRTERPESSLQYYLSRDHEYYSIEAQDIVTYFEYGTLDGPQERQRQVHICHGLSDGLILLSALRDKLISQQFVDRPGQAVAVFSSSLMQNMEANEPEHVIQHKRRPGEVYSESFDISSVANKRDLEPESKAIERQGEENEASPQKQRVIEEMDDLPEYKLGLQSAQTINEIYDKFSHSNPQFNECADLSDIEEEYIWNYQSFDIDQRRAEMIKYNTEEAPKFEQ